MIVARQRVRCCAICGSTKDLQEHHLGLRNHAPFFTLPLCAPHHRAVHIAITRAGVSEGFTDDQAERARRARMAAYVFLWFLDEQVNASQQFTTKETNNDHEQ